MAVSKTIITLVLVVVILYSSPCYEAGNCKHDARSKLYATLRLQFVNALLLFSYKGRISLIHSNYIELVQ